MGALYGVSLIVNKGIRKRYERSVPMTKKETRDEKFQKIWDEAFAAGMKAGLEVKCVPMGVTDGIHIYTVADGPCGFAWVNLKPGYCPFAKWLKRMDHARSDPYYKGVTIWVNSHNQSVTRKSAHAEAMADVFEKYEFKVQTYSRLD